MEINLKEFKVLEIYDTEMQLTNQKVIVLKLAEIEKIELSNERFMNSYGESKKFLVDFGSVIFQKALEKAENDEYLTLDISEFRFRNEVKNGIEEEIAYHSEVFLKGIDSKEHYLKVYRMK